MFHGSIVALITPFKNGKVDEEGLRNLVEFQIAGGTDGIVPCGTTGESATLSHQEHCRVIEIVIDQVKGRIPVIAGAGSNSTAETVFLAEHARKSGADAVLLITPYYNKPTQDGLYHHFKHVAENVNIPQILYNVPSRTGVNMLPETVVKLSKVNHLVGIKEASGNVDQASAIIRDTADDFTLLSGEDSLTFPLMAIGAKGVISVVTNIVPDLMAELCRNCLSGNYNEARKLHYRLFDIFKDVFLETNPIPVKKAMYMMGLAEDEIRLPLISMSATNTQTLKSVMQDLGVKIING